MARINRFYMLIAALAFSKPVMAGYYSTVSCSSSACTGYSCSNAVTYNKLAKEIKIHASSSWSAIGDYFGYTTDVCDEWYQPDGCECDEDVGLANCTCARCIQLDSLRACELAIAKYSEYSGLNKNICDCWVSDCFYEQCFSGGESGSGGSSIFCANGEYLSGSGCAPCPPAYFGWQTVSPSSDLYASTKEACYIPKNLLMWSAAGDFMFVNDCYNDGTGVGSA